MQLKYQALLASLKQEGAPPLILLYGEERYHRDKVLEQLIDATVPPSARDFNLTILHGKDVNGQKLLEEIKTFPVFSDRRMVVVKEAQLVPASELEKLEAILPEPVPDAVVVFVADKVDKRRKFFQLLNKTGVLVEFKPLYDNQIPAFVQELLAADGTRMTESAMAAFCRRSGTNLQEIASELQKLKAYVGDLDLIDQAEVEAVVSRSRHQSVFDLTDALGGKDAGTALRVLRELLAEGESPVGVLSMLVRHFRQLWKIRDLLDRGISSKEIPKSVGVNPYFVNGLIRQARNFSAQEFRAVYRSFVDADLALKSSGAHPAAILEGVALNLVKE